MVKIHNKAPARIFNFGTGNELSPLRAKVASKLLTGTSFMIYYISSRIKFEFVCGRLYIMYVIDVMVQNQVGLHARPATFFIQKANEFKSSIWVEKDERRVNAKSLLGVLSLGIMGNTQIRIIAGGPDEEQAVDELVKLVESGFAE